LYRLALILSGTQSGHDAAIQFQSTSPRLNSPPSCPAAAASAATVGIPVNKAAAATTPR
jgi:hypothetical protein